ncbi:glycoside hydrolase family 9 protein [Chitinispirillales bacterium ANBcel5]|uniref:glycoside hydrolase family 9 protein n=1 Tax=Cellulosispirillum alkaliphilum TaxID=3039283 RepID=UPI002A5921F0|nr:glycoside hydrolase family 9 protein [Chitinispirillales bacterium ANBcel5]
MRIWKTPLKLFLISMTMPAIALSSADNFRLNQLGYHSLDRKVAIVIDTEASNFEIIRKADEEVVFEGKLSETRDWAQSGESGRQADFSELREEGVFQVKVENRGLSHPFSITDNVLEEVANASMRSYYFQRCSYELTEEFAGKWARPAGHPDTAVSFHPSSGREEGTLYSPGGWYDAGDFGKYIVNSGISTGTLLAFYENFPDYFPDGSLNIPESGNGRPDILDEIQFNVDWMKTMQDEDGGVFFKLTTLNFPGYIMPHEDNNERFAIGKSTTSALNFAAVMAMAGRVYEPFDEEYAKDCIERAKRAWAWAQENPSIPFNNPPDVRTGEYRDQNFSDEFIWAASELFITTGEDEFKEFLLTQDLSYSSAPSWQNVHSLAALSLSTIENDLPEELQERIKASVVSAADNWIGDISRSLYRIPNANFIWGSNSIFANMGIAMIYAYKITGESHYILSASEVADYLLGKNATTFSFMTGFGSKATANPHHRHSVAAEVGSVPGFLAGGPNAGRQDSSYSPYTYRVPAKSYEDAYKSYASNEVAINWNAPSTFLFGAIDAIMNSDDFKSDGPFGLSVEVEGDGSVSVSPQEDSFEASQTITLKAKPSDGAVFSHWTGVAASNQNPVEINLISDSRVVAVFINPAEMVVNGDFSGGIPPWDFGVHRTASATGNVVGGEFKISPKEAGDDVWNIQITQSGLELRQGRTYRVSFDAHAPEARKVFPNIGMSQDPWDSYIAGGQREFEVGPEKDTYSFTFTMEAKDDLNGRIEINCGTSDVDVYLSNISVQEVIE